MCVCPCACAHVRVCVFVCGQAHGCPTDQRLANAVEGGVYIRAYGFFLGGGGAGSIGMGVCAVEIQTLPLPHPTGGDGGVLQAELESMHFSWHR